jgi:hypothetical protein
MIRITLTLTGALAALAFSAATAHADLDAPTPFGPEFNSTFDDSPLLQQTLYDQDFSLFNAPAETFEGAVHYDRPYYGGGDNYNVSVEQDISGNVPVGEQYNDFRIGDGMYNSFPIEGFGEVYNSIGGTPEAFFTTPFGDLNFPTWFVEAVGPTFFEPSFFTEPSLYAATLPAAELPGLAADLASPLAGLW